APMGSPASLGRAPHSTTSWLSCVRKRPCRARRAMIDELFQCFHKGDRLALARLLSLAARGEHLVEISRGLPRPKPSLVTAFTGSGGVGKSSLVGKLIDLVRAQGPNVAVLACDPQSPLTGGALLGDRFRMGSLLDDGV